MRYDNRREQDGNRPYNSRYSDNKRPTLPKARIIAGRKPMLEALQSGVAIDKIFVLKTAVGEDLYQIKKLATDQNIAVSYVPGEKLDRLTKVNHQGVVAIAALIQYHELQNAIDHVVSKGEVPLFVVLDGVTDTRNMGAIARSAYCFGAQAIVIPASNSAAVTAESVKTSAGALEHILVCRAPSIEQIIDVLHLNGINTIAADLKGSLLHEVKDLDQPLALVLGGEGGGISNYVIKNAQALVRIPQSNNFDSLNVSVASGVILYEVYKSRM